MKTEKRINTVIGSNALSLKHTVICVVKRVSSVVGQQAAVPGPGISVCYGMMGWVFAEVSTVFSLARSPGFSMK